MAEFSGPFSGSDIATELQWSRMARRWGIDGVHADDTGSTALKVTGSGASTVDVAAGDAYVNGFYYSNDSNLSLAVSANGGGTARVDLVVLRCDQTANEVTAEYKIGGTVAPDLEQDEADVWEIPLAQCTVAAGSSVVTAANVVDKRYFTGKSAVVGLAAARRPSVKGMLLVEGNDIYLGDGSNWNWVGTAGSKDPDTYTPVWTSGSTTISWGSGSVNIGKYKVRGKRCDLTIQLQPTGNPAELTDPLQVSLPVACASTHRSLFTWNLTSDNGEGSAVGIGMTFPTESTTKIARLRYGTSSGNSSSSTPNSYSLFNNFPINIRAGDVLTIDGSYWTA